MRAKDEFGTYLAIGLTILVGVQVLFNLGVAMGLLPTKGLNLPFVSFGGSALVVSLFAVGVLLNISRECALLEEHSPEGRYSQGNVRKSAANAERKERS